MTRYLVRIFYNGKNYHGYQRQPDVTTVEETLINALRSTGHILSPEQNHFLSASRTDKHVNAIGNVIGFNSEKNLIVDQINAALPIDSSIVCWSHCTVEDGFSPKYSLKKKYWYFLDKRLIKNVSDVTVEQIEMICSNFIGENDYRLFCRRDHRETRREIENIKVKENDGFIIFEFLSQSFLWEQVRRIVGYIQNYWNLPKELQDVKELLGKETTINDLNIQPAEPHNLILVEHIYENFEWQTNIKAVEKIKNKIQKRLLDIKQEEEQIKSIYDYF